MISLLNFLLKLGQERQNQIKTPNVNFLKTCAVFTSYYLSQYSADQNDKHMAEN